MIYLNENNIKKIGIQWDETVNVINDTVKCLGNNDFAQPIKPYLRYRNIKNRIIAMPAFAGGDFNIAGIKWIASFPDNINKGIPRAHSIVILNNADTGEPMAIINTALLSIIRTASVSGLIIKYFDKIRKLNNANIGIIGFGPIGQYHLKMCSELFSNQISQFFLYDIKGINESVIDENLKSKVTVCKTWQEAYTDADIFITCTVSEDRYIDKRPKSSSLHLNVSLRDYKPNVFDWFKDSIFVDDWEEVCRENTDIERMHKEKGLLEGNVKNIVDFITEDSLASYDKNVPIMFNPMGMAIFDVSLCSYYLQKSKLLNIGTIL